MSTEKKTLSRELKLATQNALKFLPLLRNHKDFKSGELMIDKISRPTTDKYQFGEIVLYKNYLSSNGYLEKCKVPMNFGKRTESWYSSNELSYNYRFKRNWENKKLLKKADKALEYALLSIDRQIDNLRYAEKADKIRAFQIQSLINCFSMWGQYAKGDIDEMMDYAGNAVKFHFPETKQTSYEHGTWVISCMRPATVGNTTKFEVKAKRFSRATTLYTTLSKEQLHSLLNSEIRRRQNLVQASDSTRDYFVDNIELSDYRYEKCRFSYMHLEESTISKGNLIKPVKSKEHTNG